MPQAGVLLIVLLHLDLDVVQGQLEVGRHLLSLLLLQTCPLHPLLLPRERGMRSVPVVLGEIKKRSIRLIRCRPELLSPQSLDSTNYHVENMQNIRNIKKDNKSKRGLKSYY